MAEQHEQKAVTFSLNGRSVTAGPGETVLSVAKREEIDIPALCHHESVTAYGACRLCVVEAFWGKRSKLVTSCIYTPWDDERIETDTPRVRAARKLVLELMLARCPGVEVLQALGREYGAEATPNPDGDADERCILCGLCIRVCNEQIGQHAIGFAHRGTERVVTTPFDAQSAECIGCAACVEICPTQALHYDDADGERHLHELHTTVPLVACRVCGETFATAPQLAKMQGRVEGTSEYAETCPRCRGTRQGRLTQQMIHREEVAG